MLEKMRLVVVLVALAACEDKSDFPAEPSPIAWHAIPRVAQTGTLDGTGFRIDVPRGATSRPLGTPETIFESNGLTVTVRVEQEAVDPGSAGARVGVVVVVSKDVRPDRWLIVYDEGKSTYSEVYVGDGAVTCNAQANGDGAAWPAERTAALVAICKSLVATTPLGNPMVYPTGVSPHELRASACRTALEQLAMIEGDVAAAVGRPPRGRKLTKAQLADRAAADAARAAAYARRQTTCEKMRWSRETFQCLFERGLEQAKTCAPDW